MTNRRSMVLLAVLVYLAAFAAHADKYVLYDDVEKPVSSDLKSFLNGESKILSLDLTPEEAAEYADEGMIIEPAIEFTIAGWVEDRPNLQANWADSAMSVTKAHALSNTKGSGKIVCVIDTGIDRNHTYLSGKVTSVLTTMPNGKASDDHGHGTHVASLVVGATSLGSVATSARIISVKALGADGVGDTEWISKAVELCANKGANIINMSLSSERDSSVLRSAVRDAMNRGVVVVAAAGNTGGAIKYPAAYSGVISVGASTSSGGIASFSSYGSSLRYVAPGHSILGARNGGGTIVMSGTSMAAPFVAGLVASKMSRGSKGIIAEKLNVPTSKQGAGQVDALKTAENK